MKRFIAILMAMIIVLSLGAAAFADYTINAFVGGNGGGSVSGGGTIAEGSDVTLTATPDGEHDFYQWVNSSDAQVSKSATYKFTPTESGDYYAQFTLKNPPETKYTITASVGSAGGGTVSGGGEYAKDASVTLTATADSGYEFVKWVDSSDAQVSPNSSYTFTATADATFYAQFAPVTPPPTEKHWVVTSVNGNGGYVSAPGQFDKGAAVTITATAMSGYVFDKWTLNGAAVTENPHSFSMPATDVTAVAYFKTAPVTNHTVSYYPGQYCTSTATYTDTKTAGTPLALRGLTYNRSGYVQTGWCTDPNGVNGTYYPLGGWYTAEEDIMLFPYWTKSTNTYTVTVRYIGNPDANGYVSDAANNYIRDGQTFSISAGESHSFTVHTDPGYYAFKVWTEGATSSRSHGAVYNGSSFSVVNPSENKILYVRFENARYYPPTGDESNLGLFAALALMSVLGCAAVVTVKKHEH